MPIRVAIPDLVSPSYFPAIAAVELGFFAKEGLDASIELLFPVTRTFEQLREGRLDFVGGAAHAALYAFPGWRGCKLLCALSQNMYWFLVVRRDLRPARGDLRALKGLRIGAAPTRRPFSALRSPRSTPRLARTTRNQYMFCERAHSSLQPRQSGKA